MAMMPRKEHDNKDDCTDNWQCWRSQWWWWCYSPDLRGHFLDRELRPHLASHFCQSLPLPSNSKSSELPPVVESWPPRWGWDHAESWGNTKGPTIPDHKRPDEPSAQTISSRIHHSIVSPLSGKEKHTKYDSRRYGCSLRDLTYWQGHKHRMWQSSWGRLLQGGWACGVSHLSIEQTNLNHLWYLDHRHLQIQNLDSLILFNIGWFWERDTPVCRPL